jgi:LmbE family N-acetylglucosaminyl deacetylase
VKNADNPTPVHELALILERMKPEVVYLHNPADKHDTHIACFLRSLAALRAQPRERRPATVYGCEVWRDLDWLVGDSKVALPAGDRPHLQAALAGVFDTQISGGKRYDLAVAGRRVANATFHDSHTVDAHGGLTFAMDLTPLIQDDAADPVAFTIAHVKRLADDIWARFTRVG